jgi:UDP-N-acetyl-D-mannosaminuronate dehydrogenase
LTKKTVLVVGLGEVGHALLEMLQESGKFQVYGFDVDEERMRELRQNDLPNKVDIMHVCIPCANQKQFIDAVVNHAKRFKPKLIIINSTVKAGTTMNIYKRCGCIIAHSPIRGVHKDPEYMKQEIRNWTKYVGGATPKAAQATRKHFTELDLKTKVLKSCVETELAKLFETSYRAWMITCFQEMHRISRKVGADFDQTVDLLEDTHRKRFDRPVMFPGPIGGHCLIPNMKLLLDNYDSKFVHLALESNEKRIEEMKDPDIAQEVEKIRKRAEALQKYLMTK